MNIPESVLGLIKEEQASQQGKFGELDSLYLAKISEHAELVVHQSKGRTLGFIYFYCNAIDKRLSYITLIGTSISSRGTGVGTALVSHVICLARQRGFAQCQLEVRKENMPAIRLYEKLGFKPLEDRGEKILMNVDLR